LTSLISIKGGDIMDMTFDDYIHNPMGIKTGVFTQREVFRGVYTDKLNKILVREAGKIQYFLYKDTPTGRYFIHMKVPSEVIAKFYYDVVIEFSSNDKNAIALNQLNNYTVKFYSNDPAFVYTFAYAFLKNNVFIKDLVPRMSKEAVTNAAKEKNPKSIVGYVKSIYFAYLLIKNYGLLKKVQFDTYAKPYDLKTLLKEVEHADVKVAKRKKAQTEVDTKNKKKPNGIVDKVRNNVSKITNAVTKTPTVGNTNSKHGFVNKQTIGGSNVITSKKTSTIKPK